MHDDAPDTDGPARHDARRRDLMRGAACMASACAAAGALPALAAAPATGYARSQLVTEHGDPLKAAQLRPGEPMLFNYPYEASPAFLLMLDASAAGVALATPAGGPYAAPAGVGPRQAIVAFCAICPHKLMYPTPAISFIGVRKGQGGEPAQVIHCCGDGSRYDPAQGGRVLAGPAPQPLAAVVLEWDARSDHLFATGLRGGEVFSAFFEKYAFKLEMQWGARARQATGPRCVARPAAQYSRQWQQCPAA